MLPLAPLILRLAARLLGYLGLLPLAMIPFVFAIGSGALGGGLPSVGPVELVVAVLLTTLFRLPFALLAGRSAGRNGQTLSKQMVGLRIVRADGTPLGMGRALTREFVWPLLYTLFAAVTFSISLLVFGLIELVMAASDPEGRRIIDRLLGTRVTLAEPVPPWLAPGAAVVPGQYGPVIAGAAATGAYAHAAAPAPSHAPTTAMPAPHAPVPAFAVAAGSPPPPPPAPVQPDGWYADPSGTAELRWWAGGVWTEHTRSAT